MIVLVPIGPVPLDLLSWLTSRLRALVTTGIDVGTAVPLPRTGYEPARKQYRSDVILDLLQKIPDNGTDRFVGMIDKDCFAPGLNFIFGQAEVNGRNAFVALPRLRPDFHGLTQDKPVFRDRTLKEILHELGHTWGLGHCSNSGCVMYFSNSLEDTDKKGTDFCQYCQSHMSH